MAEHVPELILVELEIELHPGLITARCALYVLYPFKYDSDFNLCIIGIWVISSACTLKIIMILLLNRIIDVVYKAVTAPLILFNIPKPLIRCF